MSDITADDFDIRTTEILDELRVLNRLIGNSSIVNDSSGSTNRPAETEEAKAAREAAAANRELSKTTKELTPLQRAEAKARGESIESIDSNREAIEKERETRYNNIQAFRSAEQAVQSFTKSLFDSKESLSKYNSTLSNLGDGAVTLGKNFGKTGEIVGYLIKGFTKVAELFTEQADNLLKFSDGINRLGAANAFSTKELLGMANKAGFTAAEFDKLLKPMQSMGSSFKMMGSGTAEATKTFLDMTNVGSAARSEFRRLGYSKEQLVEAQSKFIETMTTSGRSIETYSKTQGGLAKASLEYQKNLTVMSELTGRSVEQQQEQQRVAAATIQWQLYEAEMQEKISKAGGVDTQEGKKISEELKGASMARDVLAKRFGAELGSAMAGQYYRTGTIVEGQKQMALQGSQGDVMGILKSGVSGKSEEELLKDLAVRNDTLSKKQRGVMAGEIGTAAAFNPELAKDAFGGVQQMIDTNLDASRNSAAAVNAETKRLKANAEGKGATAEDPAIQARDKLVETEIALRTGFDKLLGEINPLVSGFTLLTVSAMAAAAALSGAAMLGRFKFADKLLGKNKGGVGGPGRPGGPAPTTALGRAENAAVRQDSAGRWRDAGGRYASAPAPASPAGGLSRLSKFAGPAAGLATVGFAAYQGITGYNDAQKELEEKKITEAEANKKKASAVGGATGTAAGGVIGAVAGQALIPIPVVGALIGGAIGSWAGDKLGKMTGEYAADTKAKADKEAAKTAAATKQQVLPKPQPVTAAVAPKPTTLVAPVPVTPPLTQRTEAPVPVTVINTDDLAKALQQKTSMYRQQVLPNIVLPQRNVDNRRPLPENQQYTVKQGDTLNSIGQQFKTTIEELINNNPNLTQKNWKEGLELSVPKNDTSKLEFGSGAKLSQQIQSEVLEKVFGNMQRIYKTGVTPLTNMQQPDKDKKQLSLYQKQLEENRTLYAPVLEENTNLLKNQRAEYDFLARSTGLFKKNMDESTESFTMLIKANKELYEIITGRKYDEDKAKIKDTTTETAPTGPTSETSGQPVTEPVTGMPSTVPQNVQGNLNLVAKALREKGFGDENYINAVLGNVLKESGGKMNAVEKIDYSNTSNNRIRDIFKSKTRGMSDQDLTALKEDPQAFANKMYERTAGNKQPNDGWTFRGRGPIQLTGRGNYAKASKEIFGDDRLVKNPDLVLDPTVGAEVVAWYMEDTHKGMRKKFGFDKNQMLSKQEAALLATSQIAGQKITAGQGYLGTENLGKVQSYAQNLPTGMGTQATENYKSGGSSSGESDSAGLQGAMREKGLGKLSANKPDNVKIGPKTDISNMDSKLLTGFYSAAKEYGGPITVNSAFRDDQYQGELWVRGRILGEKGIHTPSPPKNDVKITYGGKTYDVPGSGKGSKHREGEALDISADFGSLDPLLNKYGLHRPFKANDPPHVQLKAEKGGVFKGPDSGYPVELHGTEMVVPMDNRFTRSTTSSSYTVNGKEASKKDYDTFMNTNPMLKNMQNKSESLMNSLSSSNKDIFNNMSSMSSNFKNDISGIKEEIINKNNFVDNTVKDIVDRELQRISQVTTDNNAPATNMMMDMKTNMNQMMRSYNNSIQELNNKMSQLVDAINDGNSTRNKILRKTI